MKSSEHVQRGLLCALKATDSSHLVGIEVGGEEWCVMGKGGYGRELCLWLQILSWFSSNIHRAVLVH